MKYAIIRQFIGGWDFTEFLEDEILLHDSWKEASDNLLEYISTCDENYYLGITDRPYDDDCMVVRVEGRACISTKTVILNQLSTKGELIEAVFGDKKNKVDTAIPIDLIDNIKVTHNNKFFFVMSYIGDNSTFGKLVDMREMVNIVYTYDE